MPDAPAPAPGLTLGARLRARIASDGPLTFAAWMEACLYDPDGGFYAQGARIGTGGHFATSPTAHPAFAAAVRDELEACRAAFGDEAAFRVIEAGPGDGTLALELAAAAPELILVERAAGMRALQERRLAGRGGVRWVPDARELRPAPGFVVANELLDALPVRLLEPPHEILVGLDGDRFAEVRRPAPADLLAALTEAGAALRPGGRYAARPGATDLLTALAGALTRGRLLLVDYGGEGAEVHDGRRPPVRSYVAGQPGGDPLQAPGRQDLTADVDFGELRRAAARLGLTERAYLDQGEWLARHGVALPAPGARTDDDWRLAGLLDRRLPFKVLLLEVPGATE